MSDFIRSFNILLLWEKKKRKIIDVRYYRENNFFLYNYILEKDKFVILGCLIEVS